MATFIQQFQANGNVYELHDSEFIVDTRSASGAALTGVSKASALFDGMQITFWLSYAAASSATLNLTLADGTTTGAIPCYYSGTTRLGTNYAAGNAIRFIYRENVTIGSTTIAAGWWSDANYSVSDTNYDIFGVSIPIKTRLNAYCLCAMVGTEGTIAKQTNTVGAGTYWQVNAFTQSSGTGATKKLVANQGYYPGKLFYFTGSSAITDAASVSGTLSASTNNMDLRYTVNGSSSANIGVTGAPFFLVGSLGSDGLFYPNGHASEATKEWWQCGFPTDLTSTYVYWFVGMMTSKYQCRLSDHNWMLKSDGTKWIVFDGAKKVHWDNIEGKPSTFTPASHTHGYIGNDGSVAPSVSASPAIGDKILISDLTDSNKVKGGPEIGSNDGKFLRHDGVWDTPDDHILVMTGTPTGNLFSAPINTTTTWDDYVTAIANHDRLILDIPSADVSIELIGQDESYLNSVIHLNSVITSVVLSATNNNGNVQLQYSSSVNSTASYAEFAGEAQSFAYSGGLTNGTYNLSVTGGSVSWTPASEGLQPPGSPGDYYLNDDGSGTATWMPMPTFPNTPDAPVIDGNYVLNVDNGSSSWQEETKEVVAIVFDQLQVMQSMPYIYTSTGGYRTVVSLCQQKVAKVIIAGSILDTIFGTTGMSDIICMVTGCVETDPDATCLLRYSSITLLSGAGILNKPVVGALELINLDPGMDGACVVNPSYFLTNQYYFEPMGSSIDYVTVTETQVSLTNGLLSIATTNNSVSSVRTGTEYYTVKKID